MKAKVMNIQERTEARKKRMETRKKEIMALKSKNTVTKNLKKKAVDFLKKQASNPKNQEIIKGIAKEGSRAVLEDPKLNEYLYGVPKRLIGAAHSAIDAADINMGPRFFQE